MILCDQLAGVQAESNDRWNDPLFLQHVSIPRFPVSNISDFDISISSALD